MANVLDIPPAGPDMDFFSFARYVDAELRRDLPRIVATKTGERIVLWRYDGRTAMLTHDNATYRFVFDSEGGGTMASLCAGDRKDRFVATNLARSIAGFFDAAFSVTRTGKTIRSR